MELCIGIEGQEGVSWDDWTAIAAACEAHDVPALFCADHYLSRWPDTRRAGLDAWGTLCGLAAVTRWLRLGSLVSAASFRHPSVLAKLAITADHVSGGRLELGMGAGWYDAEHRAYGFPVHDVRTRMDILEEQVEVVSRLLGPSAFSFAGDHYAYPGTDAQPKPVRGHIPLILGGEAGPRAARIAARWADEYNSAPAPPEECRRRRARLDAACRTVGRDPGTLRFSVLQWLLIGSDAAELRGRARTLAELHGQPERDPDRLLGELAASDWCIAGTPDAVAERLRAFAVAGADRVVLALAAHRDLDQIALIGRELAPRAG